MIDPNDTEKKERPALLHAEGPWVDSDKEEAAGG
jgi:hypothetical protein